MARNDLNLNRNGEEAEKSGGGKGRLLLWVVLAVLLLGGGAGAAWFFLANGDDPAAAETAAEEEPEEQEEQEEREAHYLDLGRFLVNFDHKGGIRYVQTEMELMAYSQDTIDRAERNRPAVRNEVIMLLSGQDFDALRGVEGKEQLRRDALAAVNKALGVAGKDAVQEVYFTAFVLQ
jgi:flagellar FliL protein